MASIAMSEFPNDADGDALRRIAGDGSDLARPMFVDFQVAVPDRSSAELLAATAVKLGYRTKVYDSPACKLPWTCECSTRMLATYEAIIAFQRELEVISRPFGGIPDGWGTFGNGPMAIHPVR
jgi:regulator of RNase E activity RraB